MSKKDDEMIILTSETDDPKLSYIEFRLHELKIKTQREENKGFIPKLLVARKHWQKAREMLGEQDWQGSGLILGPTEHGRTAFIDLPDNDKRFTEFMADTVPSP